jgi:aryl-alcohol dehydrogenase-like predicted oxidoreductase
LGLLTGKYAKGVPADSRGAIPRMKFLVEDLTDRAKNEIVAKLAAVANELGCSLAQLAIAWCAKNPHVSTVITGASRVSQVTENMKAAAVIPKLAPEVMARIDAIAGAVAE